MAQPHGQHPSARGLPARQQGLDDQPGIGADPAARVLGVEPVAALTRRRVGIRHPHRRRAARTQRGGQSGQFGRHRPGRLRGPAGMRERLRQSVLMDEKRFIQGFEKALMEMAALGGLMRP